ncbi:DUF2865 domain-containing protein [Methylocystis sp. B8]|uniref:DUF2865 domain-containing protein n=1 Tax=Methylocystis sp. B8 TaxID=544938 RepID=UPI0010FED112|nr:DUF2865 domain-containing protein [Methylocystis sp. B8]TLG72822.1 DUF2865 domain-containing protein [Methylocystis sp. B8]
MRLYPQCARVIAGALAAAVLLLSPFDSLAQGDFFEFLFGPSQPYYGYPSRPSWRVMRPRAPRRPVHYANPDPLRADTDSMSGGGYCVRACDGYYFPLIKSSVISGQQSCQFACPATRVQLYEGPSIEEARNAKGERYTSLSTAFSFREKLTPGCSCNEPAESHDYYIRLSLKDPTLRTSDIVVGEKGAFVYSGSSLVSLMHASRQIRARLKAVLPRKFTPVDARISQSEEDALAFNKIQRHPK